jgi:hypothetical protein
MEETLAVDVLGTSLTFCLCGRKPAAAIDQWVDLVKTCDQPRSVLIQIESLILAQSERWRQA